MTALVALAAEAAAVDGDLGRWAASGYAEGYAIVKTDPASRRQRPAGMVDLNLTGDVRPDVRVYLDTRTIVGGTPEHADGFGVFNVRDTFQDLSPSLEVEEGFVDVFLPHLDVRLGKQQINWGRLDTFHPTDVVTPRRYTDPFLMEESDAKIGVPAVRASYFPPDITNGAVTEPSLSFIWVPVPVLPRFPTEDERWFPAAVSVPPELDIPKGLLGAGLPAATVHSTLRTDNAPPPQRLDAGAVGVRATAVSRGVDWSLSYYDGPETLPAFDFRTVVFSPSAQRLVSERRTPTVADLESLQAEATLRPRFGRIRMAGGDLGFPIGGFTARLEAAYGNNRLLPRTTADLISPANIVRVVGPRVGSTIDQLLKGQRVPINLGDLFVARDTVEWGAGVDYPYHGWTPVVQINQMLILHNSTMLLINDVDTRLLIALRKSFLADRLATEVVGFQGFERSYTAGIARVAYSITDNLRLRVGYLLLAGTRRSVVGQYQDLDEAFVQVRYSR